MRERTIWVRSFVPRAEPKLNFPCAVADVPVAVREIDSSELTEIGLVRLAREQWDAEEPVRLFEHDGKLWRRFRLEAFRDGAVPEAAVAIAQSRVDNPVLAVAMRHRRQYLDIYQGARTETGLSPHVDVKHADPSALANLSRDLAKAGKNVLICEGTAYQACHEPTWIVVPARQEPAAILVQPFLAEPGAGRDAAWFSFMRRDAAEAFAEEMAKERGGQHHLRGEIDLSPGFRAPFDDVAFAESRVRACFGKGALALAGTLPERMTALALSVAFGDGGTAVAQEVAAGIQALAGRADVDALLSAGATPLSQLRYFQANALFSEADEEALGSLSFR